VAVIDSEAFVATPGPACTHCAFTSVCPAKDSGHGVVA
jgi:hypothetical protein